MKNDLQPSAVIEGVKVFHIPGHEGVYSVSKCGRVWSHSRRNVFMNKKHGRVVRPLKGRWLRQACHKGTGYMHVVFSREGKLKTFMAHRLMALTFLGIKRGMEVDHINGDKIDNRLENLRVATRKQNATNRGSNRNTSSRFKGVHYYRPGRKWSAAIGRDGITKRLGYFDTEEEAAAAYDRAAAEFQGEFAKPNLV